MFILTVIGLVISLLILGFNWCLEFLKINDDILIGIITIYRIFFNIVLTIGVLFIAWNLFVKILGVFSEKISYSVEKGKNRAKKRRFRIVIPSFVF